MIDELNTKLGLSLDPKPNFSRGIDKDDIGQPPPGGFLVIGSSNTSRTADALRLAGQKVTHIKTTNWKPTPDGIISLTDHVREARRNCHHKAIVFHLLDNILYIGRRPDGTTAHSKRGEDGIYHVEGDLIVADKEAQYNLYKALKPVLTAAGSGPIIIITPLPRYVNQGCCSNSLYVTNRDKPEFNSDITHSLAEVRNNWRSFLFVDNLQRISIVNPQPIFDTLPDGNGWGPDDPVHPLPVIHSEMSNIIIRNTEYLINKNSRKEDAAGPVPGIWGGQARIGPEWSGIGTSWNGGSGGRGRGMGRGRPGGHRGFRGQSSYSATRYGDHEEGRDRRRSRFN